MGHTEVFTTGIADETQNSNTIKNMVLKKLHSDDIIDEHTFKEYSENYHMIIVKRSWFDKLWEKIKLNDPDAKDEYIYKFVKF